jgi:hypothetical protein
MVHISNILVVDLANLGLRPKAPVFDTSSRLLFNPPLSSLLPPSAMAEDTQYDSALYASPFPAAPHPRIPTDLITETYFAVSPPEIPPRTSTQSPHSSPHLPRTSFPPSISPSRFAGAGLLAATTCFATTTGTVIAIGVHGATSSTHRLTMGLYRVSA